MLNPHDSSGSSLNGEWHVEIVTPDGKELTPNASLVELITIDGQIGVMPGHERLMTVLDMGEMVIHSGRHRDVFLVSGGFACVLPERLSVLAFSLEHATNSATLKKCRAKRRELLDGDANG